MVNSIRGENKQFWTYFLSVVHSSFGTLPDEQIEEIMNNYDSNNNSNFRNIIYSSLGSTMRKLKINPEDFDSKEKTFYVEQAMGAIYTFYRSNENSRFLDSKK